MQNQLVIFIFTTYILHAKYNRKQAFLEFKKIIYNNRRFQLPQHFLRILEE